MATVATTQQHDAWNIGTDLLVVRATGLSTPYLFDEYGAHQVVDKPEARAYHHIALFVLGCLLVKGFKIRSETHFRIAGAVVLEISRARQCPYCKGTGLHPRKRTVCEPCGGNGIRHAPIHWRANASDCHVKDFALRLQPIYTHALRFAVKAMRARRSNSLTPNRSDSQNSLHGKDLAK